MQSTTYRTSGWVAFAGIFLIFTSIWNVMYGLGLLIRDEWVVFSEEGALLLNTTSWGWILLLTGVLKLLTGFGLLAGQTWARWVGIFLVTLNMIEHMALLGAYPFWSLIVIIMSAFILYALIVPADEYA